MNVGRFMHALGRAWRVPRLRRRYLSVADQGVLSLTNIFVALLVARSFEAAEPFGAFGLAMVCHQLILGGTRAVVGEPLLSLYTETGPTVRRRLLPDLLGAAVMIGLGSAAVLVAVASVLGGLAGAALSALALVLPFALAQDVWRFYFIVDRPGTALGLDVLWLATVVVAVPFAPAEASVAWFVLVWGLGGALGALAGLALAGGAPSRPRPWRWLAGNREVGGRYMGEYMAAGAVSHLVTTAVGPLAGLGALGAVRGSQVYYGPHNTLHAGIYLAIVPEGAEVRGEPDRLRRLLQRTSLLLAALAAFWLVIGLLLPGRWGVELFGGSWEGVRELMLPMGLATVAAAASSGGFLGLRALADARRSLRARLHMTPWQLACPLIGVVLGGAVGFCYGLAVGRVATAVIYWWAFNGALAAVARGDERLADKVQDRVVSSLGEGSGRPGDGQGDTGLADAGPEPAAPKPVGQKEGM